MKTRIILVAIGLSLALTAARANDVLQITEVGGNLPTDPAATPDIVATLNGFTPVAVALTGPPDGRTIELPAGFLLNLVGFPGILVGEPENPSLFNRITITAPTFL